MTKMIYNIINKNYSDAEKLVREGLQDIAERKIVEMKKMIAAKNIIKEEASDTVQTEIKRTIMRVKAGYADEESLVETVDYPMTYSKLHDDHVEMHHITMLNHDNQYKTPERMKQQVHSNPMHKELKSQGYKIYKYGEHAEPKDFYTRPVKITKGSSASVKDQNIAEAGTTPPSGGRRMSGADLDRLARRIVYGIKIREKAGAERKRLRSALRAKKPADPNMQQEAEETLHEARFRIIKARIRNGKIQRRKKISTVPGLTFRGGKLIRMSPAERRRRKMGQRRGKLKRRTKLSRTLRKRTMSLRKRSRLGIKS